MKTGREQSAWCSKWRLYYIAALGGKCNYCGETENLELDHVVPVGKRIRDYAVSQRPKHWREQIAAENLQVLCTWCNKRKSNKTGKQLDLFVKHEIQTQNPF